MWGQPPSAVRGAKLRSAAELNGCRQSPWKSGPSRATKLRANEGLYPCASSALHFLNKLSNAARASFGFRAAGVEVSFSRVTRIS